MNKTLVPTLLVSALLATGCSFIPKMERATGTVADQYPAAASAGATAAAELPWQSFFTDARLQQLIGLALENNRDLRVAALNVERTQAQYQIQRAAQWPQCRCWPQCWPAQQPRPGAWCSSRRRWRQPF